jgi:PiT family inorganic phosphate transporter
MWRLISGLFMGWSLGANDAANIFGTGVGANVIRYRTAVILISGFLIIGAILEGPKCMEVIKDITSVDIDMAFKCCLCAAVVITLMTILGLPTSTSQAIMGALVGATLGLSKRLDLSQLSKVLVCWLTTPLGAAFISSILYILVDRLFKRFIKSDRVLNICVKVGLIIAGCYGAYSLGANNTANVTGVYYAAGMLGKSRAAILGGVSIALGVLTYSRRVMHTIGYQITQLGPLGAFIAEMAQAITVHIYTQVGVPVSTSHAIVGAVVGIGLVRGIKAVGFRTLGWIMIGWVSTPTLAGLLAFILW